MFTKRLIFQMALMGLVLISGIAQCLAEPSAGFPSRGSSGAVQQPSRTDFLVWCQTASNEGGYASHLDTSVHGAHTQCIDDFTSDSDYAITRIAWGGIRTQVLPIEHFLVTVYAHDGVCDPPSLDTIIWQEQIHVYQETPTASTYFYWYTASVPAIPMDTDRTYWLSIQAVLPINPDDDYSAWWWTVADTTVDCPAMIQSEYYGSPDWVPLHVDTPGYPGGEAMNFCLYSDHTVDMEHATWGQVKALFR